MEISNCCNAYVKLNKPDAKRGETIFYICEKCGNSCDIHENLTSEEEYLLKNVGEALKKLD